MHRSIVGFHQDLEQHWVAELDCGHCQHTRHEPPFFPRPWVITEQGRLEHIGQILNCVLCEACAPSSAKADAIAHGGRVTISSSKHYHPQICGYAHPLRMVEPQAEVTATYEVVCEHLPTLSLFLICISN